MNRVGGGSGRSYQMHQSIPGTSVCGMFIQRAVKCSPGITEAHLKMLNILANSHLIPCMFPPFSSSLLLITRLFVWRSYLQGRAVFAFKSTHWGPPAHCFPWCKTPLANIARGTMGSKIINCGRQAEEEGDYKMESFLYPAQLPLNQCMGVGFYF